MTVRKKKPPASHAAPAAARISPPPSPEVTERATEEPSPEEAAGFEGSYDSRLAAAMALAKSELTTFTGNALVVYRNVRNGVDAVLAQRAHIEADPTAPKVDFARIEATVRDAEALVFAADAASTAAAAKGVTAAKMVAVYKLRDMLLSNAVSLVKSNVIKGDDADLVAKIAKGRGPIDAAQDLVALAALFRRVAADIKGVSPVTPAMVQDAARLGSEALGMLSPRGVAPVSTEPDAAAQAAEMRDRMAALLRQSYAYVARIGGWLWGHEVDAHVPLLRSRAVVSAEPDPPPPARPVTPV